MRSRRTAAADASPRESDELSSPAFNRSSDPSTDSSRAGAAAGRAHDRRAVERHGPTGSPRRPRVDLTIEECSGAACVGATCLCLAALIANRDTDPDKNGQDTAASKKIPAAGRVRNAFSCAAAAPESFEVSSMSEATLQVPAASAIRRSAGSRAMSARSARQSDTSTIPEAT